MMFLELIVGRRNQFGALLLIFLGAMLYMYYPELEGDYGKAIANIIVIATMILSIIGYKLFLAEDYILNDMIYTARPWEMGSYANYIGQTGGIVWTSAAEVVRRLGNKKGIKIDRFTYMPRVKNRLFLLSAFKKWLLEKDLMLSPKEFTRGSLAIGQMGAGKTEFLFTIAAQNRKFEYFQRMLFHDVKGDITEKFYRKRKDVILNPFDKRAAVWDFMGESSYGAVEIFFNAYMAAVQGKTRDFFSGSAKDRFMTLIKEVFFLEIPSAKKWEKFMSSLDSYFAEVAAMEKSSEKDVAQTLKLQIQFFRLQHWLILKGAERFTIKDYFAKKGVSIFMLNNPEYAESLNPYFSGFIAAFTAILAAKPESKNDYTLLGLDEYLTFVEVLPDTTIKQLHTLIRSKGGCLMAMIQYLPERSGDKNLHQALMNSAAWIFAFETMDNYTFSELKKNVGKATYQKVTKGAGTLRGSTGHSARGNESRTTHQSEVLDDDALADMKYHHLTYSKVNKLLYRGYTPRVNLESIAKPFIPINLKEFYSKFSQK
jgi:hypothetical protein